MNFNEIKQLEYDNTMHTFSRFPVAFVSGKGSYLTDIEGKRYLDMGTGIGVCSMGHADPDWAAAIADQAAKLAHISNLYYTVPMLTLAKTLTDASGMSKVFFSNSGCEANEGAIKLARKYSHDKYGKGRYNIVTLRNSFHGRTITTLAATGQDVFHQHFFPFTEGFSSPVTNTVSEVLALMDDTTCAVMLESVQGEGGVYPLEDELVKAISDKAKEKDILLIFDEVQAGIGRTGKLMGFMHYNVEPDIVSLAKGIGGGLPIGAFMCTAKLENVFGPSDHGGTYCGNPVACAGANVVMEKVLSPGFMDEVARKGEKLRGLLREINSPKVKQVRGLGLMIGIELDGVTPKEAVLKCLELGLVALTAGGSTLRLLPPLNISDEDIVFAAEIIGKALEAL